jgi:hypothetical protein
MPKDVKGKAKHLNMVLLHTTQGHQRDVWAGPIVVCALYDGTPGLKRNVTMEDFSALLPYFKDSGHGSDRFGAAARSGRLREVEVHYPSLLHH